MGQIPYILIETVKWINSGISKRTFFLSSFQLYCWSKYMYFSFFRYLKLKMLCFGPSKKFIKYHMRKMSIVFFLFISINIIASVLQNKIFLINNYGLKNLKPSWPPYSKGQPRMLYSRLKLKTLVYIIILYSKYLSRTYMT